MEYREDVFAYQLLLLHALHEDYEEMLGLGPSVCEGLLDGNKQLISQRFIDKSEKKRGPNSLINYFRHSHHNINQ